MTRYCGRILSVTGLHWTLALVVLSWSSCNGGQKAAGPGISTPSPADGTARTDAVNQPLPGQMPAGVNATNAPGMCKEQGCIETLYDRAGVGLAARGVQVDDKDVFWMETDIKEGILVNKGHVMAARKGGGGPTRAFGDWDDLDAGNALASDDDYLYWQFHGKIVRQRKNGQNGAPPPPPTLLSIPTVPDPGPIINAGDELIVASHGCLVVAAIPKDGSPGRTWQAIPRPVAGGNTGLSFFENRVYCSNGFHIAEIDLAGDANRIVVKYDTTDLESLRSAGPVIRVGDDLFWIANYVGVSGSGELSTAKVDGGAIRRFGGTFGTPSSVWHDGIRRRLYWVTGLGDLGAVGTFDLDTQTIRKVRGNLNTNTGGGMDETYLYWGTGDSKIRRVHK